MPTAVPASPSASLRRLHPVSILLQWINTLTRSVLPLGLLYLQNRDRAGTVLAAVGGGILALTAAWSLAAYLMTRFGVSDEALVVKSGVLRRQSRVIPFGRIQSVNVQQSALQRLFRVAELRVETASAGRSAEAELQVLRWDDAQTLREQLVRARREIRDTTRDTSSDTTRGMARDTMRAGAAAGALDRAPDRGLLAASRQLDPVTPARDDVGEPEPQLIAKLDIEELMVAGGTSNNVGVLLALLVSGCQRFGDALLEDFRLPAFLGNPSEVVAGAMGNGWLLLLLLSLGLIPILLASWMVSVAGAVITYYGFTLERVGNDLRRRHGWLSRVEASVPMSRAQAVRFRQSPLRRPFQRGDLSVVSAGSAASGSASSGGQQYLLPIVHTSRVAEVVNAVFPGAPIASVLAQGSASGAWQRAAPVAWVRGALANTLTLAVVMALMVWWRGDAWWALAWAVPVIWALAGARWRVRGMAMVPGYVVVREGGLTRTTIIVPERKLQLIQLQQGPLQRLFGVATLELQTAGSGGMARMVDLPLAEARSRQESLIARLPHAASRTIRRPPEGSASPLFPGVVANVA